MTRVAVIGYGYWGPNLVRCFGEAAGTRVEWVVDVDPAKLQLATSRHPGIRATTELADALASDVVDAVIVATEVASHHEIARRALERGKHVLVEKPFTANAAQADELCRLAEGLGLVLMVDHPFLYTGAVSEIGRQIRTGELGDLYYYDSVRANLGLYQRHVNVIWDLAVHDLAILDHLVPESPLSVAASGASHLPDQPEDVAYLTLRYARGFLAHVHASWLAPRKVRQVCIAGSRRMVVYDDVELVDKVRLYDAGVSLSRHAGDGQAPRIEYRSGDVLVPRLDDTEALLCLAEHFADCVAGRAEPLTEARSGWRVVRVLEAASESMAAQGRPVSLAPCCA